MSDEETNQLGNYDPEFTPPSKDFVRNLTALARFYFNPEFHGLEHLDKEKPALYVTNHSVLGALDGTLWAAEMYLQKDIFVRSLVDDMHYLMPGWREVSSKIGFVRGRRENCASMMQHGEHIMVYPGGGRESFKRKGEQYQLTWKERTGFARMAIEHGYDIITVAQVGQEEAFDIVLDGDELMETSFGRWLQEEGIATKYLKDGESMPPLVRGVGPTFLPRPERQFYAFGQRISTKEYEGQTDEDTLWALREKVKLQLELDMTRMRILKLENADGNWLRNLLNRL